MTENIEKMLKFFQCREFRKQRKKIEIQACEDSVKMMRDAVNAEKAVIFENDFFGFNRYTDYVPSILTEGNLTPNYKNVIENGFGKIKCKINQSI